MCPGRCAPTMPGSLSPPKRGCVPAATSRECSTGPPGWQACFPDGVSKRTVAWGWRLTKMPQPGAGPWTILTHRAMPGVRTLVPGPWPVGPVASAVAGWSGRTAPSRPSMLVRRCPRRAAPAEKPSAVWACVMVALVRATHHLPLRSAVAAAEAVAVRQRRPGVHRTRKASKAGFRTLNRGRAQRALPGAGCLRPSVAGPETGQVLGGLAVALLESQVESLVPAADDALPGVAAGTGRGAVPLLNQVGVLRATEGV